MSRLHPVVLKDGDETGDYGDVGGRVGRKEALSGSREVLRLGLNDGMKSVSENQRTDWKYQMFQVEWCIHANI